MSTNEAPKMSITVTREQLFSCMARVNSIVERRNTIPILSNALICAKDGRVEITATDLDVEVTDSFAADRIDMEGEITIQSQTLHDLTRKMAQGCEINMVVGGDNRMQITAHRSSFNLPTLPRAEYPVMAKADFRSEFKLPASVFKNLIDRTKFAMSTEQTRHYLCGIYLHVEYGHLLAVATDGHRLALSKIETPAGAEDMPAVIVPRKSILEIRRLIETLPKDSDILISVSDAKIMFSVGHVSMVSKLIDGSFPDYQRVIPKGNPHKMTVDGDCFRGAVDRVATISTEKSRSLTFTLDAGKLTIACTTAEASDAKEDMNVEYDGDKLTIGFNSRYLVDTLTQVDSSTAEFYFDGPASPAVVYDPDCEGSLFVLMPLRV